MIAMIKLHTNDMATEFVKHFEDLSYRKTYWCYEVRGNEVWIYWSANKQYITSII